MTAYAITTTLFLAGSVLAVGIGVGEALRNQNWRDVKFAVALITAALCVVYVNS